MSSTRGHGAAIRNQNACGNNAFVMIVRSLALLLRAASFQGLIDVRFTGTGSGFISAAMIT